VALRCQSDVSFVSISSQSHTGIGSSQTNHAESEFWRRSYRWIEAVAIAVILFVLIESYLLYRFDIRAERNAEILGKIQQNIQQCIQQKK
jgi:hypothetical protein